MLYKSSPKKLLQVIESMIIGGAQKSASSLMKMPRVEVELVTYEQLDDYLTQHYDAILLHVWCTSRDQARMNWPTSFKYSSDQLVVFNHDWHGLLNFGANKYVVHSQFAYENSVADSQIYIVPGAIATEKYMQLQPRSTDKPIIVGRLSTMHRGKISEEILRFWQDIPVTCFSIGGDGSQRKRLEAAFKHDQRFLFPGLIQPRDVPQFLANIDIFLYDTARHVESFCYAVLEAMAAGCVVVARDKGAINELIKNRHTGFLYTSEKDALSICHYLIDHPDIRASVGSRAREYAFLYTLERFWANVLTVLEW
jgi:glycosyltransferase involved in cell wall biosynthesis